MVGGYLDIHVPAYVSLTCWIIFTAMMLIEHTAEAFNRRPGENIRTNFESPVPSLETVSDEKRLVMQLMANYSVIGTNGRPLENITKDFSVKFGLGLIQMSLDEHEKVLSTSMWARYLWIDDYLKWNPDDFGGVKSIKLDPTNIWMPDIMLYNTADTDQSERTVLVTVRYDGIVMWVPHQIFRSSCSINITNFPFDNQVCTLWFGSWSHSMQEMNVLLLFEDGIDLATFESDYKESCAWEVINVTARREELPPENPSYVMLEFQLHMQRKHVFSTYILTLPCVFLAALTLVVFWLPPDRPDRTSLAMNIFASFLVLLLILVEAAPPTAASVPSLGVYYCFNMVIIMMSIFLSSMVVNVSRMGDEKRGVSPFVRKFVINILARWLCPSVYDLVRTQSRHYDTHPSVVTTSEEGEHLLRNGDGPSKPLTTCPNGNNIDLLTLSTERNDIEAELRGVKAVLSHIYTAMSTTIRAKETQRYIVLQWRTVSIVMDRLFFMFYFLAIISSISMLFPRPQET